ncbi:sigma factor-like helix-turn-helix DNA-binding protein [Pseudoflavonifractor sp. P01025]|uniref:sigma factor-like helix-turn-helix DNA-binding protein n=1 Tax=Flintibacter porci TaxID=3342383 RepID=UPI0035B5E392
MSFYYGREKRIFDKKWARLEEEYAAAGMDSAAILEIKVYDWKWFCSQRVYHNHVQKLPSEYLVNGDEQSVLFRKFDTLSSQLSEVNDTHNRYDWIAHMEDPELSRRLQTLSPEELELLTLLVMDGYRQADIARIKGCSRNVIYKKLKKIKKILKKG